MEHNHGGAGVTERIEEILAAAIQTERPVLVNPTEDEIRLKAEELRMAGKLMCTGCRKPIQEPQFRTRRIAFGPRLEAVAHLHVACESAFFM
jgi:Na+-translocating ferredoxin:NAD+ oxidoreductase RNF subunit RnfB